MEFAACKLAGTKLIVVLGHTACGAVKGACDHARLGNLTALIIYNYKNNFKMLYYMKKDDEELFLDPK